MRGCGKENKADACFKVFNGGTVWFRTAHDPDSIVGITNVRGIWGDEAGKFPLYFWENIQARASFRQCPVILTTSPYSLNWVYKDIIRPTSKGLRDDCLVIQAASYESPYFPMAEYERKKATMDPKRFKMVYGGQFEKPEGLVYGCFDEDENVIGATNLGPGTKFVAGVDWGYTHPFVIKVRAIDVNGNHFDVSEFYKTQMTISQMVDVAKKKMAVFGIERFWCDPSRPDYIAEFQKEKIPALAADNSIRRGIDIHYELIKTRKYKMVSGRCPYTLAEIETYHYPEEQENKTDKDDTEKSELPVDTDNHALDSDRYISIMTYKSNILNVPTVPSEDKKSLQNESSQEKIARLKRGRGNPNHENF